MFNILCCLVLNSKQLRTSPQHWRPPPEEGQDQGGAQQEQVMEEEAPWVPPTQVRATIQRNHPVDQILGDISNGVTTRSRLANFCEHYSFVSSIEPFRVEEALQDLDWVLAMQEELNNFKRNAVWILVPQPKQTVVGRSGDKKQGSTCGKRLCPSRRFGFRRDFCSRG
jgi:hypothetical protein